MADVFLALGSNLGDRRAHLAQAYEAIAALPETRDVRMSPVYETAPVGGPAGQGAFLNAAVALRTDLPPGDLLAELQRVERAVGRPPRDQRTRWGPRVLDIDVLLYDDRVIEAQGLKVPHPRMHERWFVLKPLADLAPERTHPTLHQPIRELLRQVEQHEAAKTG